MNQLVSIRANIYYSKNNETEYTQFKELIFLVEHPLYKFSNEQEVIRERQIHEYRIVVSENNFEKMIEILKGLKEADETGLGA